MKPKTAQIATLLAFISAIDTSLAAVPGDHLNFVACPIMRDTDIVPCWLAEYDGETYFLGIQTDIGGWTPPQFSHKLLVEGRVTDLPRVCGGIVSSLPVRSSTAVVPEWRMASNYPILP